MLHWYWVQLVTKLTIKQKFKLINFSKFSTFIYPFLWSRFGLDKKLAIRGDQIASFLIEIRDLADEISSLSKIPQTKKRYRNS